MEWLYLVLSVCISFWVYLYITNKRKKPKVLVIEGIIGAGKTTLLEILPKILKDKYRKIVVITEPVEYWKESGFLKEFYDDMEGKAYEFQTMVFVTRITNLRKVYEETPDADLYIIERSPFTDRKIFAEMLRKSNKLKESQMIKYELWWNLWSSLWPFKPTHFIHLCPGVKIAQERVKNRDREGEEKIKDSYQEDLLKQHFEFFNDKFSYPLYNLMGNGEYISDNGALEKLKSEIIELLDK